MRVIEVKYGCEWEGWGTNIVPSPYGVCLWKTNRRGWPSLSCSI